MKLEVCCFGLIVLTIKSELFLFNMILFHDSIISLELADFISFFVSYLQLTIILRNRSEYRLILGQRIG